MQRVISTPQAPAPLGHYSQAIVDGDLLFVSGQLPVDPGTARMVAGSIELQMAQVLLNIDAVLRAAGATRTDVAKVTLYVSSIEHWPTVNRLYAEYFGAHRPARSAVPTGPLHLGAEIEVDLIARLRAG